MSDALCLFQELWKTIFIKQFDNNSAPYSSNYLLCNCAKYFVINSVLFLFCESVCCFFLLFLFLFFSIVNHVKRRICLTGAKQTLRFYSRILKNKEHINVQNSLLFEI